MLGVIFVRLFYLGLTAAVLIVGANNWMNRNYFLGGVCIVLGILMVVIPIVHAIKLKIAYGLYNRAVQNERKTRVWVYRTVFKNEENKKRILEEEQNPVYAYGEQSGMKPEETQPGETDTMQTYQPGETDTMQTYQPGGTGTMQTYQPGGTGTMQTYRPGGDTMRKEG